MRRFACVILLQARSETTPSPDAGHDAGAVSDAGTCIARWALFSVCVVDEDGGVVSSDLDAGVTVVATSQGFVPGCSCTGCLSDAGLPKQVLLEASDGKRWRLVLEVPGLPAGFFSTGQQLDLSVRARSSPPVQTVQTLAVSAAGALQLIGMQGSAQSYVSPELLAGDLTVTDEGVACSTTVNPQCTRSWHRARVAADGGEATLVSGQTARVGPYAFTVGDFFDGFGCDINTGVTAMGGYRVP